MNLQTLEKENGTIGIKNVIDQEKNGLEMKIHSLDIILLLRNLFKKTTCISFYKKKAISKILSRYFYKMPSPTLLQKILITT